MSTPLELIQSHRAQFERELCDLLRIPSVSTLPARRDDVRAAADWIATHLRDIGLTVDVIPTTRHPLVYAEWLQAPGRPTVLGYGHYDVQPSDPDELWTTPPYSPTIRNGGLYARGAADDKGQLFTLIAAIRAYVRTRTPAPVNVKLIIEGEEESGGESIAAYVRSHGDRLRADAALVLDFGVFAPGIPAIALGLRGIVGGEIEVQGAARDLHSGLYGGVAPNPFQALAEIITRIKDADGHVLIPGFYDRVAPPDALERAAWDRLPFDEAAFLREEVGSTALTGEPDYTPLERMWARPTFEVHGMPGGFTGEGTKTVIPARATAKISMRLVPHQDPGEIRSLASAHIRSLAPRGTRVDVRLWHGAKPVVMPPTLPAVAAAQRALSEAFGREAVFTRMGGSVPIVADFIEELNIPTVVTGWATPDANAHSPNERLDLEHFHKGIVAVIRFFERIGGRA